MRELKIGRGPGNDIVITDQTVSRSHAILIISDSGYSVKDLNSGNGTYINGMRVTGVSTLADNDILKVGNVVVPWKNYLSLNSIPENIPQEAIESNENNNIESNVSFSEKANVPSANAALVLGIIGLILFWIPIVGLVLAIIAIVQGTKSNNEFRANPNKYREGSRANGNAGKVLGVIGLILTVIYWVLTVVFTAVTVNNKYERSSYNDQDGDYIIDSEDNDIDGDGFNNDNDCCPYDEYDH
ncbi:FHA domain-containing protein [Crocinitomicaceae bacterium]|nr:FHA domain-containing protein [Crocinitomicaceae bacterium]